MRYNGESLSKSAFRPLQKEMKSEGIFWGRFNDFKSFFKTLQLTIWNNDEKILIDDI